jgi:hypothetical protein
MNIVVCDANILIEKKLKTIATTSHGIKVHGVLWIFEHLVGKRLITPHMAHTGLSQLLTLNSRLPKAECERLLRRWRKSDHQGSENHCRFFRYQLCGHIAVHHRKET